jgi:hypothetical protein
VKVTLEKESAHWDPEDDERAVFRGAVLAKRVDCIVSGGRVLGVAVVCSSVLACCQIDAASSDAIYRASAAARGRRT